MDRNKLVGIIKNHYQEIVQTTKAGTEPIHTIDAILALFTSEIARVETEARTTIENMRNRVRLAGNPGSDLTAYKGIDDDDLDNTYSRLNRPEVEQMLTDALEALKGKEGQSDAHTS